MLSWADSYSLVLFDFDGLLVNTEKVHFKAYTETIQSFGFTLGWDLPKYLETAHFKAEGLEEEIYRQFPELKKKIPDWKNVYRVKRETYLDLLRKEEIEWMPGAKELIGALYGKGIKMAVVTHSDRAQIDIIRGKLKELQRIGHWVTREDYQNPKPSSDCYRFAIDSLAQEKGSVIGFEDSPRGLTALLGTEAKAVLVTEVAYPDIDSLLKRGAVKLKSLKEALQDTLESLVDHPA